MNNPKSNSADALRKFNIKKRRETNQSPVPVVSIDFEMASNISVALESDEMDPFIFPFFDVSSGAVFVEHYTDGSAMIGFLNGEAKATMSFTLPTRSDVLFFAKGFATAAGEVASSPNHDASALIRTDVASFHVSDVVAIDDPRRSTEEQIQIFVAKLGGGTYIHKEHN